MEQSVKECIFMAYLKKAAKLTAGILCITLALGSAGSLPSAYSATPYSDTEAPYQQLYSYVFEDMIVNELYLSPERCRIVMGQSANLWGFSTVSAYVELNFDPLPELVETENGQIDKSDALRKKNYSLLSHLKVGSTVTIKAVTDNCYSELLTGNYNRFVYDFEEVASVYSPDIHLYGDINDDGTVDSYDAILYRKLLAGNSDIKLTSIQLQNGDINLNNKIDDDDFRQIQDFLLGAKTEFNEASPIGSIRLDNTIDVLASEGIAADDKFASAEMDFGIELLKRCFDPTKQGGENFLVSPLSVSTALAMTANGADGTTRDEMEKVLGNGLTIDEINEYIAYYMKTLPDLDNEKVYIANSIWFKDKPEFQVYDKFLETDRKYYSSEIYKSDFDDSTVKDINSWVNTNTRGMIPNIINNGDLKKDGDLEPLMMLINTLYFEADWAAAYTNTYDGVFTDLKGDKHKVKHMSNTEYEYFDLGDADAFKKPYINGNYSFVGILPRDDDIIEYVNGLDSEKLFDDLRECEDPDEYDLTVIIPEFKYSFDTSLKDVLKQMGMESAFYHGTAVFSKLYDTSVENAPTLYIEKLLHKTKIEVTQKGTKAAAATAVGMFDWGGMSMQDKKKIVIELNRPFVYMIVDNNNIPLFIGVATNLGE